MTSIAGIDPRTATQLAPVASISSAKDVDDISQRAAAAAAPLAAMGRYARADMLDAMAAAVEARRDDLVETASLETGFGAAKLNGELTRAAYQLSFFGEVLREGSYLEAAIDPAGDTPMGPRPDLRRLLVPIGPTAVFGASNFPFAFSVLGGDTASALAAGCPVVVKAHDSHPATSKLSYEVLAQASDAAGAPSDAVGIVYGLSAGAELVAHSALRAVAFTGSLAGGRALLDIIGSRPDPIPFYGELSSVNPVIVTPHAAGERSEQIGRELAASVTVGAGQLCTKPGVLLVPKGADGDRLVAAAAAALSEMGPQLLLNARIHASYVDGVAKLAGHDDVAEVVATRDCGAGGFHVDATLFEVDCSVVDGDLIDEIFGPTTIVVRYDAEETFARVATVLQALPHSLTATIQHGTSDGAAVQQLTDIVGGTAGRIVYNGFPTGVAVSWAQTYGGPWPATNSLHTSVGATAIRRFLRPMTYQNAPESVLPLELRDDYDRIARRIDGVLTPARS